MAPTGQTTTPEEPQETAEQPTARAPRRRRKATAAATAPEPAPQAPAQDLTQGPAGSAQDPGAPQDPGAAQDADPAPAPEPTASPAGGQTAATREDRAEDYSPREAPGRQPRRRRKATAAATAPEPAPQAPDQDLTQGPAGPAQDPGAPQAPDQAGAQVSDQVGAQDVDQDLTQDVDDQDDQDEAPDQDEGTGPRAADRGPEPGPDQEPEAPGSPTDPDQEPEAVLHLPAASLLFQVPDPSRARRRRKATAAATAPAPRAAQDPPQEDAQADQDADGGDASGDASGEGTAKGAGSRGRTRRRRKATAAATAPAPQVGEAPDQAGPAPEEGTASEEADAPEEGAARRRRRRGGRGRRSRGQGAEAPEQTGQGEPDGEEDAQAVETPEAEPTSSTRRRRRRSRSRSDAREARRDVRDEVTALKGSTRLEAKRQRRREGRAAGRHRPIVTEAEFLARRESVDRQMIVREVDGLNQIAVLEDGLLVEHYVARRTQSSMVGNVYVGRVQNVLPSMEAAFVDLGKGRNAVLYAGEVNWDAAGMEGRPRRIEDALSSGDPVLVQVTKDPIGHKGARLTSQVTLAGRYLVLVPGGTMTGISRKLPDTERARLKKILKKVVPDDAGVIVRTAAEGASEEQLGADVERLLKQWRTIDKRSQSIFRGSAKAPALLKGEPELALRVVRDVFNEDFRKLIVSGPEAWRTISEYVSDLSPDLVERLEHWVDPEDVFTAHRIDEQLAKGFDRKVWLPSGGTLVIDRTEAMTVIDVNTGRFTGAGGTLEETVTRNNLEAAEEIVRQLRLRDIGGMVVIDFVDMVLESNRDLVLRRLVECLGRDRTRHQVTEVTSLGLVQMTRKRVGQGLVEAFSTPCECCGGRGFIVHDAPVENQQVDMSASASRSAERRGRRSRSEGPRKTKGAAKAARKAAKEEAPRKDAEDAGDTPGQAEAASAPEHDEARAAVRGALAQIAAAAEHAHEAKEDPDA
ncbi:Rne/Rng family ribonuclease [Actinomyces sp. oral taxon 897]|uniref:Rne/Rng family ribonuclease n=1 Tax=Actinomyces sp. oral taxon 897 TaxID=2081702 RepID=UPI000D0452FF|nr:Rne/Rng family ribonuclease [Actinomyces sp. oral taxon 897]AVM61454.1 ribonuclease E/G [Actinomyces sp. oral taxon 897]